MSESIEQWRPIPGWEGSYEISDRRRIRRLGRTVATRGRGRRWVPPTILQPGKTVVLRSSEAEYIYYKKANGKEGKVSTGRLRYESHAVTALLDTVFPDRGPWSEQLPTSPTPPPAGEQRWLHVPGWEGAYMVSDWGLVQNFETERILATHTVTGGYLAVTLQRKGRSRETRPVHRLVLTAFVGGPEPGQVCRHLNGVPADNRLENLCWGTQRENVEDTVAHGRGSLGCYRGNWMDALRKNWDKFDDDWS